MIFMTPTATAAAAAAEVNKTLWMVLGTTASVVVSGSLALVMAYRRDAMTVAVFLGAIANGILSKLLKKIIQQARPSEHHHYNNKDSTAAAAAAKANGAKNDSSSNTPHDKGDIMNGSMPRYGVGEEEGMPSSHSMSLSFIWALMALHYPPDNNNNNNNHHHHRHLLLPSRLVAVSISLVYVLTCATYRIHAKLHTWQQVFVGLTLGIVHAWLFIRHLEPDLTAWITAHVLTTTAAAAAIHDDDDAVYYNNDGKEEQRRMILPAPWLVIPFTMTVMIGAKVDLRIMQWLSSSRRINSSSSKKQLYNNNNNTRKNKRNKQHDNKMR